MSPTEADRHYRGSIPDQDAKHQPVQNPEACRAALVAACERLGIHLASDSTEALKAVQPKLGTLSREAFA